MSSSTRLEQMRKLTADTLRRRKLLDQALRDRLGEPPRPGDLVVGEATQDTTVQWAVIDRDAEEGRLLIVPADTFPFSGTADLEIVETTTGTPLTLRCRHSVRVSQDALDPARRSGSFDPTVLWDARRKYQESRKDEDWEHEADLEYLDWVREILEPARAAWSETGEKRMAERATARLLERRPASRRRRWTAFGNPYALAASVLLMISLALAGGLAWQTRRLGQLVPSGAVPHSLPMAFLSPAEAERGEGALLSLPPEAPRFALVLTVDPLNLHDRYRVCIHSETTGTDVWTSDPLSQGQSSFLSLELPQDLFPEGKYRIRLEGLTGGDTVPAGEYAFEIRAGESQEP